LPKNAYPLLVLGKPTRFIEQIDDGHGKHGELLSIFYFWNNRVLNSAA
jgi:hypothetical protein